MTLSNDLSLEGSSTLDMAGYPLSANSLSINWSNGAYTSTILNRAALTVGSLNVANQAFDLNAADVVLSFSLKNGTSTINTPIANLVLTAR